MALVLLILGLVGAGIWTENTGFYYAAGVVGGFWVLFVMWVGSKVRSIKKEFDKGFSSSFFNDDPRFSDLQPKRIVGRRGTGRRY